MKLSISNLSSSLKGVAHYVGLISACVQYELDEVGPYTALHKWGGAHQTSNHLSKPLESEPKVFVEQPGYTRSVKKKEKE